MIQLPPQLITFFLAALPVGELRVAIPVAIGTLKLGPVSALVFSVLGTLLPVPFIYALLPPFVAWAERHSPFVHRVLTRYFRHLHEKHGARFERVGLLALFLLVATPLPGAGVWSGTALAILFKINPRRAVPAIVAGAVLMGLIVLGITTGAIRLFV